MMTFSKETDKDAVKSLRPALQLISVATHAALAGKAQGYSLMTKIPLKLLLERWAWWKRIPST